MKQAFAPLNRRRALALIGGAGAASFLGSVNNHPLLAFDSRAITCVQASPEATEGPYWVDEKLNRSDIRVDPSTGAVSSGLPLTLSITIQELSSTGCGVLPGAQVDIWHCDAAGIYSDEAANNSVGRKFLRGYQITDDNGTVQFTTIYPGWYSGRTVHIHVRIRTFSGSQVVDQFTSQFFFDDSITDQVFTQAPYNSRGQRNTRNSNDMVLTGVTNGSRLMLNLTQTDQGYAASAVLGVSLKTATVSQPVIAANGVVSAAGYQAGVAPGSWVAIFGQNLAASTRQFASSDLVDGNLPATLGGVSVQIDSKPAFMYYVSPTLLNVQAPADSNTGSVQVTATNASGTSDPITVTLQSILPAFFNSQNYVAAVRIDGTLITSTVAAKPGDVLELFGTGFGPTDPSVTPGNAFSGSAPHSNPVTVTIGGVAANVSYAGLVSAGLTQINLTIPDLPNGDHEVIAQVAGFRTLSGVLLKIQS